MQAQTIDEVIAFLDEIIQAEISKNSKLAYFPILYRKVTHAIKVAIEQGEFEDNSRMERLDVVFANRYLEAYTEFKQGQTPSLCWKVAFDQGSKYWPIVLQHLLLGINAHINLDLGVAAAELMGNDIKKLKPDFYKINEILSSMVDGVQADIDKVSPIISIVDRLAGKLDERLVDFSIQLARDGAWDFACQYAQSNDTQRQALLRKRDDSITWLGSDIANPGLILGLIVGFVKLFEWKKVQRIAPVLEGP